MLVRIEPLLDGPHVEFLGEVCEHEKQELLGGATALLFPIDWSEPFGLVMIEAMACGTPVVAWRRGSVPEVLEDGVTGYLVESIDDAVSATMRVSSLSRARCRATFEKRFTAERMAREYVSVYEQLVDAARHRPANQGQITRGIAERVFRRDSQGGEVTGPGEQKQIGGDLLANPNQLFPGLV